METQTPSVKKIAMTYGVLWGLGTIILGVIGYVTNNYLERSWTTSLIGIAIMIAAIVFGLKAFKKDSGGYMSFGEGLKTGMAITLIAALIGAIWTYLFVTVIEPDFVTLLLERTQEQMLEQNPDMTDEQIDVAIEMTERFTQPWLMSTFSIIGSLFFGFITSLICSAVMKVNRPTH